MRMRGDVRAHKTQGAIKTYLRIAPRQHSDRPATVARGGHDSQNRPIVAATATMGSHRSPRPLFHPVGWRNGRIGLNYWQKMIGKSTFNGYPTGDTVNGQGGVRKLRFKCSEFVNMMRWASASRDLRTTSAGSGHCIVERRLARAKGRCHHLQVRYEGSLRTMVYPGLSPIPIVYRVNVLTSRGRKLSYSHISSIALALCLRSAAELHSFTCQNLRLRIVPLTLPSRDGRFLPRAFHPSRRNDPIKMLFYI
ncbi:hypothetical protein J6590_012028 [Homalodisca vitripennis]|nr:hypothetical protein J6590_012028 [Homalodisca vitripennis]